ncbi:MAG: DUF2071 domain-containing protein [Fulvivirga sp.]|nr:DUF2071 domain-containing protein [Fulvivirga sp.]
MSFLKAEWRKLALANYAVDPSILTKYIPAKTELDLWQGTCYVSLVGFMFLNTRLLGIPIPFHRNFEEVNLRFYVRHKENGVWKRGVVFVKEIVPRAAITWVANNLYHEHYQTMPMAHDWKSVNDHQEVQYRWKYKSEENELILKAGSSLEEIEDESETEFITEHYWGYTRVNDQTTSAYEVRHPRWQVYEVVDYGVKVNFGLLYGDEFDFLSHEKPKSVMLAEGSAITVENKRNL